MLLCITHTTHISKEYKHHIYDLKYLLGFFLPDDEHLIKELKKMSRFD